MPMSKPETPKRVLTESVRASDAALSATRLQNDVDEELHNALRNLGARVRKNVTDGYASSRFTTPNTSPIKPPASPSTPDHTEARDAPLPATVTYFTTTSDILHSVYTTPPRSRSDDARDVSDASRSLIFAPTTTSRTKKRNYTDSSNDEPAFLTSTFPKSTIAIEDEMDVDDDVPLCAPFPPIACGNRKIKSLRQYKVKNFCNVHVSPQRARFFEQSGYD